MTPITDIVWKRLLLQAEGLVSGYTNRVSNAANLSALLYQELPDVSWVGFYYLEGDTLMVGAVQGKPACVSIALGKGLCGRAAETGKTLRVGDVDSFDGHIVCDAEARSEVVVPLFKAGKLVGVLDLDSTSMDRFTRQDEEGLEALAQIYLTSF